MLTLIVALAALAEAPKGIDEAALKKLQGSWQVTAQEHGGKRSPAKELASLTLEVARSRFTTRDGGDVKEDAEVVHLDARATPAAVDLKITAGPDRDKVIKGIWKLDGEELTVCIAEPGRERPKEFKGAEGMGQTLLAFKRAKK